MSINSPSFRKPLLFSSLVISLSLAGCASTPTPPSNPSDPWEGWNRGTQKVNDTLDKAIIKPVAKGYEWLVPNFVNKGVTNFFSNMHEINVTINDILQFKLKQGGMDASRFLINSTAGVGGFIDVAKYIDLPKHNEDFGQTLGYWGVPSGPYLVLPFFGPSSPRETLGLIGDMAFNPLTYVSIFGGAVANAAAFGARAIEITDQRAHLMTTEKIVDEGSIDRYDFLKNSYKQNREYYIHDGNPLEFTDPDLDEEIPTSLTPNPGNKTSGAINKPGTLNTPVPDKNPAHILELTDPK
jgi:phospholipid-binding lipoprotein MlaA